VLQFVVAESAGEVAGVDWQFNAWGGLHGGLYPCWDASLLCILLWIG
jgi:agmatine/peptidylarginine deiminase